MSRLSHSFRGNNDRTLELILQILKLFIKYFNFFFNKSYHDHRLFHTFLFHVLYTYFSNLIMLLWTQLLGILHLQIVSLNSDKIQLSYFASYKWSHITFESICKSSPTKSICFIIFENSFTNFKANYFAKNLKIKDLVIWIWKISISSYDLKK